MDNIYKNRDWLYMAYQTKKLSTHQIAKEVNAGPSTIWNWLYKFNIPIRSNQEGVHLVKGNHCNLSQEAKEWIDGELLGDGCLCSQSSYSANFFYGSKYLEYIQYVSDTLQSFGIKQAGKINKDNKCYKNFNYYTYFYASRAYVELLPVRKRWYPDGKKIVPKDVELTPLTVRQWYIGDGCLLHLSKRRPFIVLSTCGFSISDVEWLVEQLDSLGFRTTRRSSNNTIHISAFSTQDFLAYIDKCPVRCYQYKWNYTSVVYPSLKEYLEKETL